MFCYIILQFSIRHRDIKQLMFYLKNAYIFCLIIIIKEKTPGSLEFIALDSQWRKLLRRFKHSVFSCNSLIFNLKEILLKNWSNYLLQCILFYWIQWLIFNIHYINLSYSYRFKKTHAWLIHCIGFYLFIYLALFI